MSLRAADIWEGELVSARVDGVAVVLVRTSDRICAYVDRCAHLGVALSEGALSNGVITCRAHHWQYDAATGCGLNPREACLRALPVDQRGELLHVDVSEVRRGR